MTIPIHPQTLCLRCGKPSTVVLCDTCRDRHTGSSLDSFLEEEGILRECEATAMSRVTTWTKLAQQHGAKAAVSLAMTDEELDTLTQHQSAVLIDALRPLLNGDEHRALDYGCGAARLTPMLHDLLLMPSPLVWGYDPCREMLDLARQIPDKPLILTTAPPHHIGGFDVILMAMVLGDPDCRVGAVLSEALKLLAPGGLFILLEHMRDYPPPGRWWRFRSKDFYRGMLYSYGLPMADVATLEQGENPVTVLAGRSRRE